MKEEGLSSSIAARSDKELKSQASVVTLFERIVKGGEKSLNFD